MSDDLMWEAPPKRHKRSDWFAKLLRLRERPGEWARLAPDHQGAPDLTEKAANTTANVIRNAADHLEPSHPGGAWEITARQVPGGLYGIWATWKPAQGEAPAETNGSEGTAPEPAQLNYAESF